MGNDFYPPKHQSFAGLNLAAIDTNAIRSEMESNSMEKKKKKKKNLIRHSLKLVDCATTTTTTSNHFLPNTIYVTHSSICLTMIAFVLEKTLQPNIEML